MNQMDPFYNPEFTELVTQTVLRYTALSKLGLYECLTFQMILQHNQPTGEPDDS